MDKHIQTYFDALNKINKKTDQKKILNIINELSKVRKNKGRIFF